MHQGVGHEYVLDHKLMRLYIRPGLSARVVAALQNRLRQAMSDGNGAHASASPVRGGDQEERARSRSRARGEGVTEANAPEEPHQEEKEDGGDAPGTPGAAKKVATRQELMKEIVACTKTLASATEDVSLAIEEMKEGKRQMSDGFKLLAEKMEDTCKAVVTMGASVTHQSAEITRMLRAFDKHAGVVKWALKTNAPLEQSVLGISTDVTAKMEKLEGRVGLAFENVSKGIVQLIEAIQNPPGAPSVLQSGQFPPAFPIPTQGTGGQNAPLPPGNFPGKGGQSVKSAPSGMPMASGGQNMPMASGGQNMPMASGGQNMPMASKAIQVGPPSFAPTPMTPGGIGGQSEVPPPPEEPMLSSFIAFLPLNSGEQMPNMSLHPNTPTPRKGVGMVTHDHKTRGRREISPTGYSHQQLYALTSAWCPAGVASPHNGKNELHRIYV